MRLDRAGCLGALGEQQGSCWRAVGELVKANIKSCWGICGGLVKAVVEGGCKREILR